MARLLKMKIKFVVIYYNKFIDERSEKGEFNEYETAVNYIHNSKFRTNSNYYVIEKRFYEVEDETNN